jgi:hypothetical protein
LNENPQVAFRVYGGFAIMYAAMATYGFLAGYAYLGVAAIISMVAMMVEAARRWRSIRRG